MKKSVTSISRRDYISATLALLTSVSPLGIRTGFEYIWNIFTQETTLMDPACFAFATRSSAVTPPPWTIFLSFVPREEMNCHYERFPKRIQILFLSEFARENC